MDLQFFQPLGKVKSVEDFTPRFDDLLDMLDLQMLRFPGKPGVSVKVIESESDSIMLFVDVGYFLNFEFIFLVRFWMNIYIYRFFNNKNSDTELCLAYVSPIEGL